MKRQLQAQQHYTWVAPTNNCVKSKILCYFAQCLACLGALLCLPHLNSSHFTSAEGLNVLSPPQPWFHNQNFSLQTTQYFHNHLNTLTA